MYWLGRLLCKLGWHDWYEGIHRVWCRRDGCSKWYSELYDNEDYDG